MFLGAEVRRAQDEQEAAHLLRASAWWTGWARTGTRRAPQGRGAGSGATEQGCVSVCQDHRFALLLLNVCDLCFLVMFFIVPFRKHLV